MGGGKRDICNTLINKGLKHVCFPAPIVTENGLWNPITDSSTDKIPLDLPTSIL